MPSKSAGGVTGRARDTVVKILDHVLRDECSLSATTSDYRCKVTGPNLYSLHRLFDEQRRQIDYWLDKVIERTKSAGLAARIPAVKAPSAPAPAQSDGGGLAPSTIVGDLLARHERMAERLRADIERLNDPGIADLLSRLLEFHETTAWMLRMIYSGPDLRSTA
jgi:starvation-inducible DNA-binding protein